MVRQLKPLIFKESYWRKIYKSILESLNSLIYQYLIDQLNIDMELKNQSDPLIEAINSGEIYYNNGNFFGDFNSKISRSIKELGGKFNRSKKSWKLPEKKLTSDILSALTIRDQRDKELNEAALNVLDNIDTEKLDDTVLQDEMDNLLNRLQTDLSKTLSSLAIPFELTENQKDIISEEWATNLNLFIKNFANEDILKLREQVLANTKEGLRAENLNKIISKNFGITTRKAKFLARQETSLLVSKYRETKYTELGLTKYKWSTSQDEKVRPFHQRLNNKEFTWDSPPIVDEDGHRKHPGEDFNCRCVAIPVIL